VTITALPLASLIEDFSIYPRHAVDSTWVTQLSEALLAGEKLPPPIVDKKTLCYVDGWHRGRAYRKVSGADATIDVDVRSYKDRQALIQAAVDANMTHGRRLDHIDRVRCALLLREVGVPNTQIAVTLRMREPVLEKLVLRVAPVPSGANGGVVPGTNDLPLKRAAAHMAGKLLTKEQVAAHATLPGTSLTLLAKQLTTALRSGFIDPNNQHLCLALTELQIALTEFFTVNAKF
jgi:hypothetical protein